MSEILILTPEQSAERIAELRSRMRSEEEMEELAKAYGSPQDVVLVSAPWWRDESKRAEFLAAVDRALAGAAEAKATWTQGVEERDSPDGRHVQRRPSGDQRIVITLRTDPGEWP